jgi:transposase InsO family protein
MDGKIFMAELLVNELHFTPCLIDHGSSCYAIVSEAFAQRCDLACFDIAKRRMVGVGGEAGEISKTCYFTLDLDGHRQERVYAYVLPAAHHDVILGMPWVVEQRALYVPEEDHLLIRSTQHVVRRFTSPRTAAFTISKINALGMQAEIRKSKRENIQIFAASLRDIEKALKVRKDLTPEEIRERLPPPYGEFWNAFAHNQEDLPPHRPTLDMAVELEKTSEGNEPTIPWGPLYSMSRDELLVLRKTLTELLEKGFIRVSHSPAAAPVLFAKKPGGGLRFCVDYRALNAITRKDRYPLPLIQETLRQIGQADWYTKLDVRAAFHRLRVKAEDQWKTAFRTRYGLYEWVVTPFGLANGPSAFQRYINWVLREHLDVNASAYVDDILIYTAGSVEEHRRVVKEILAKLSAAELRLDLAKCEFEVKRVKYLGMIVDVVKGISMDPEKVSAIKDWEPPSTVRGVRGFLGFANYYRDFIYNFSDLVIPLTALTKKDAPFEWSPECEVAFQELKARFLNGPALANWDPEAETRVECDASGFAVGGTLAQKQGDVWRPIAFYSRKMTPTETNYGIHDKELLSIINGTDRWRAELRGLEEFTVITDHKNLEYFRQKRVLTERQVRWMEKLEALPPFTTIHRPGRLSTVPDALSRKDEHDDQGERFQNREAKLWKEEWDPVAANPAQIEGEPETRPMTFDEPELQRLWSEGLSGDRDYYVIREAVRQGERQLPRHVVSAQSAQMADCTTHGELVYYRERLWVPNHEPLRTALVQKAHDSAEAGHPGREGTIALLRRQFFWPGLADHVRRFVRNCEVCGRNKIWRQKKHGLLQPLPIPDSPWSGISMDFMTHLPRTLDGCENLLVVTCRFTGELILIPLVNMDVDSVVKGFMCQVYAYHGSPTWIVSDRGSQWIDGFWAKMCERLGIQRKLSTANHPETDGSTERANQEVQAFLRSYVTFDQSDWDIWLPAAQIALNNRSQPTRGNMSPFFMTHGRHIHVVPCKEPESAEGSKFGAAERMVNRLHEIRDWVSASLAANQQNMEDQVNRHRQAPDEFKVGDSVWLDLRYIPRGRPNRKLDWLHSRYRVTAQIAPMVYELDMPTGIHNRFHTELLRLSPQDPWPSQRNPAPPAAVEVNGEQEWHIEEILCADGRNMDRVAWCKWAGFEKPAATDLENVKDTAALDRWEAVWGPIGENDGPRERYLTATGRLRARWQRHHDSG